MLEAVLGFIVIIAIGMVSLAGLFMISLKEKTLDGVLFILIAFATGTILATAVFDLIPEAIHHLEELNEEGAGLEENIVFMYVLAGFVVFFIIERFIYWFHGHAHQHEENKYLCYEGLVERGEKPLDKGNSIKSFALLNLIGDGMHNFLDGVIIMVAFLNGIPTGIIITLAVFFHEFPQEIGDFGILVYGGFTKKRALLFNFVSAMVAILGGVFALILSGTIEVFNLVILAFSGGGFIYLAATELMPELLDQKDLKKSILQALIFITGLLLIVSLVLVLPHE